MMERRPAMFGFKFIKTIPTTYVIQYRRGKIVRQGAGLSFFYFTPFSSLAAVPLERTYAPFIFTEACADFQEVTVQGEVAYRVSDPVRLAGAMNFTLGAAGKYSTDDPVKLPQKIINRIRVLAKEELRTLALRTAIKAGEVFGAKIKTALKKEDEITGLGIEVIELSILAVKPVPETARALEATVREEILKEADLAVYDRRNAAIEQERALKENELNTAVAVEKKRREIEETKIDGLRAVEEKTRLLTKEKMAGQIEAEKERTTLVELIAGNKRKEADAEEYEVTARLRPLKDADVKMLEALAISGMEPAKIIAQAFRGLAENSGKIGTLSITPDLLGELIKTKGDPRHAPANRK
ncbi:MAG: SPFH domain-containing protein [Deltaproteobacteria bacterium]|nr:SPFH domain-containing protein [Deltaproteobacteria bacterium]